VMKMRIIRASSKKELILLIEQNNRVELRRGLELSDEQIPTEQLAKCSCGHTIFRETVFPFPASKGDIEKRCWWHYAVGAERHIDISPKNWEWRTHGSGSCLSCDCDNPRPVGKIITVSAITLPRSEFKEWVEKIKNYYNERKRKLFYIWKRGENMKSDWEIREERRVVRVLNEVLKKERFVIEGEAYFKELVCVSLSMEKGKIVRVPITLEVLLKTEVGIEEFGQLQKHFRNGKCKMIIEEM